ncbi:MAG: hypothetical protein OM95_07020 [Bdellovibrio sp. ArHS]|nr:MAG: hypothetical protein OM95_07020 [Bdellovibrio sp. ArHS]
MKKAGLYIHKNTGIIWQVDKVEYYPASVVPDGSGEFSLIISGMYDGKKKINRCLIRGSQYKKFLRLGDL